MANCALSNDKTLTIAAAKYDNFTQENGRGIYWDIMSKIFSKEGYKVIFEIFPYPRSQYLLQQKKIDAVVGAYHKEFEGVIYPSKPYSLDRDQISVIYLSKSELDWQGLKSLNGAKVGWPRGYRYEKYLDVDFTPYEVSNAQQALAMLRLRRLEFYLDSDTEMNLAINESHIITKDYKKEALLNVDIYPAFQKDDRGRKLLKIYERGIKRLKESGILKKIYESYDVSYTIEK